MTVPNIVRSVTRLVDQDDVSQLLGALVDGYALTYDVASGAFVLTDVLTPGEHTAIGSGAPHHAAVTLDTNADTLLALSTQALGLDTQSANTVLAGPATGAAAVPTMRALVSDDVPTLDHGAKLSGLADDDHTQYLLATGERTGASSQAQTFTNGIVATSGNSYLGDTANASMTQGLTLNQGAADDEILALKSSDVAHGLTTITETDTFGRLLKQSATFGGLRISGISDGDGTGIELRGVIGASNPTDTVPAVILNAYKSNGATGIAAVGAAETVLQIQNNASPLVTVLGNGNVGFGVSNPLVRGHFSAAPGDAQIYLMNNDVSRLSGTIIRSSSTTAAAPIFDISCNLLTSINGGTTSEPGSGIRFDPRIGQPFISFSTRSIGSAYPTGIEYAKMVILENGEIGFGTIAPNTLVHALLADSGTNAIVNVLTIGHDTSGTAANGFGLGINLRLETSTTAAQNAARICALWNDATHASRKADLVGYASDSGGEREGWRIRGSGTVAQIGFLGATPASQIAHVADASTSHSITDPGDSPADADALRDDLVTNVIPSIESALNALGTKINNLLTMAESFGFHATA